EFAQSGEAALQHIDDVTGVSIILILSDINMTGLELLPKAKAARPDVPVIMITAHGDAETKHMAHGRHKNPLGDEGANDHLRPLNCV
ncbi:MAG: hypothetical protein WA763_17695, partial [Pseudolabrys sp.]